MGASFSKSSSDPVTISPFGGLPYNLAGMGRKQFAQPLSQGFGYQKGKGPTAGFINQATPTLANVIPSYTALGGELASGARGAYGKYQGQIDQFLQQLPGFQEQAGAATGYAREAADEAFSPLKGRALFQEAASRALDAARPGMAARGALETGTAGAQEQGIVQNLAFNALQNEQAQQQAAIQGLSGAVGNQANIAGLGPQAAAQLFAAYPQLAQLLTQATGLPLEGANQALSFLTATQNPNYSLLRMVLPQVAQRSESFSQSAGISG